MKTLRLKHKIVIVVHNKIRNFIMNFKTKINYNIRVVRIIKKRINCLLQINFLA